MWNADFTRSEYASIGSNVKELSKGFSSFSLSFMQRTDNVAAHLCAQYSVKERQRCICSIDDLDLIYNCLSSDCIHVDLE